MPIHSRLPYELPVALTCSAEKIENGVPRELADRYIRYHEENVRRYRYLWDMYCGFHDIYHEPEKEAWKPDTRLAVNFAKYITDTFQGYANGKTPHISIEEDDAATEQLQDFLQRNRFTDAFSELTKLAEIYGHAWVYLYQDENASTRLTVFSPMNLFCVYSDTLDKRALFAVRYGRKDKYSDNPGELYGEIITPAEIRRFEGAMTYPAEPNPYGMINVVECRFNAERMGIFESVCGMIELFDRVISEKGNDVDAFAEAYLAIIGTEVGEDQVRRIRDDRIINIFGTDDAEEIKNNIVEFLAKPTADSTQENLLDRLERLIFQVSMVANISDETFGNSSSGVSLQYKLWSTDNLANTFDRKNEKTLQKIVKIWSSLSTNTRNPDSWEHVSVDFYRNVPHNTADEIAAAKNAEGIVSKKTQLSLLSFVDDPQAELDAMKEESADQLDIYRNRDMQSGESE